MNKLIILAVLILIPACSQAQDEEFQTIFHNKNEKLVISGFGAPIMSFTAIDKEFAFMMGGGCGIMIGNIFLGGYGIGKTNEIPYKTESDKYYLGMGHGGFWFGYIINPKKAIHLSISSQFGWGAVSKRVKLPQGDNNTLDSYAITVITPIIEVEYNISRYFKIGTGATWSYVSGKSLSDTPYTSADFSNPSIFLSFKFGWFSPKHYQ